MSPVPNDSQITPLIRRSNVSTSPIIELNSDVENTTSLLDDYCCTAILHQGCRTTDFHIYLKTSNLHDGCRATDYPTTTNLHQGCRATDCTTTTSLPQGCRATDVHVYPTTTNLHDGCRATDFHDGCRATDTDCGTSRPFIAIQTTPRQQGEDSMRCAARGTMERGNT